MSIRARLMPVIVLLLSGSSTMAAQSFTTLPVTLGTMSVSSAVAGSDPTPVTNTSSAYTLVTKKPSGLTRVTARLLVPLPAGVTLSVNLPSPGSPVTSNGTVTLTTTEQNVLMNLPATNTSFPPTTITYVLTATAAAGMVNLPSQSVVFVMH